MSLVSNDNPKRRLFDAFASVAKALGHGHRLALLELLAQGERSVDALAARSGLSIANASQHLHTLRRVGLVVASKRGKHVFYRLADDTVLVLLTALRQTAERHTADVERVVRGYFDDRDNMEPVTRDELLKRANDGLVTVLDVRPEDEFALGHLPGALNVPLGELEARLSELDPEREIVAYCRGPYCVLSYEAIALLRGRGFKVWRLEDGFPEWRAAGLPVAVETVAGI